MAQPIPQPLFTEEDYLAFEREADERNEYIDGIVYAMAGESPEHGAISMNLSRLIGNHIVGTRCQGFIKDTQVRSGPLPRHPRQTKGLFSYPDLVVVCGPLQQLDEYRDVLINPSIIFEVLSDSTEKKDRVTKFQRYKKYLPSLLVYVLVSQDQPLIEVFHRDFAESETWQYSFADELPATIRIPVIDCTLHLAEVYDRVTFAAPPEALDDNESQA